MYIDSFNTDCKSIYYAVPVRTSTSNIFEHYPLNFKNRLKHLVVGFTKAAAKCRIAHAKVRFSRVDAALNISNL